MQKYKSLFLSKTVWAAIFAALIGAYQLVAPSYHWDTRWVPGVEAVLAALGLYGLRTSNSTLTLSGTGPAAPDNVVPSTPADIISSASLPSKISQDEVLK